MCRPIAICSIVGGEIEGSPARRRVGNGLLSSGVEYIPGACYYILLVLLLACDEIMETNGILYRPFLGAGRQGPAD